MREYQRVTISCFEQTQSPTTDERSSTSFTVINDLAQPFDGEALSTSNPVSNFTLHPNRRMWWGSREDRNIQLWPTGRPWESIAKTQKERPPGVRSRQVTPSTAQSSRRQRAKSVQERTPDLGRLTSPSPFSPPRMLPEVQGSSRNYPIWMGRGAFIPEIEPQHYPGLPRRAGIPARFFHISLMSLSQSEFNKGWRLIEMLDLNRRSRDFAGSVTPRAGAGEYARTPGAIASIEEGKLRLSAGC